MKMSYSDTVEEGRNFPDCNSPEDDGAVENRGMTIL